MIDILFEIVLDLVLDGCSEMLGAKRLPIWLRAIAGTVIGLFIAALFVGGILILIDGIKEFNFALIIVGLTVCAISIYPAVKFLRKLQKR